jgi:hypothetical protein
MIHRWPSCLLVAFPQAAYADVSTPSGHSKARPADTAATAIRSFTVDGFAFTVSARPVAQGGSYLVEVTSA